FFSSRRRHTRWPRNWSSDVCSSDLTGNRGQRSAQVVEHLPAIDAWNAATGASKDPRQQLPVAARPAVLPRGRQFCVGRKIIEELDIDDQPAAGEDTFKQVMAQDRVIRHTPCQSRFEHIDVIQTLAGITAFCEQVLVNVRY